MKAEYAYIGIKSCGCCVAATVDDPQHMKEVAEDLAEFVESGLHVERVKIEDARLRLEQCIHGKELTLPLISF